MNILGRPKAYGNQPTGGKTQTNPPSDGFADSCGRWVDFADHRSFDDARPRGAAEVGVELSSQSEANTGTWSLSQIRQDYPVGKLVVTTDRQSYESGDLRLVIPALDQDLLVQNGVDTDSLRSGPGLYEYSQLPAPDTNANVSIAGHRDIEGAEFYYIDRLADGDLMYLVYQEKAYIYRYEIYPDHRVG